MDPLRRLRLDTPLAAFGRLPDQIDQTRDRILPVAFLRAAPARVNDEDPPPGHPLARQFDQSLFDAIGKGRRCADVESQLHRRRDFVDVLAPRAGRPGENELKFRFVDTD